jgi:hypothetical protein
MNMKSLPLSFLVIFLFVLTSCKVVSTPDGTIPDAYKDVAAKLEGTYVGKTGNLKISSDGSTPKLEFQGPNGSTDILGGECESEIGRLCEVIADKTRLGEIVVKWAKFAFDPKKCSAQIGGRSIELSISYNAGKVHSINAIIFHETRQGTGDDVMTRENLHYTFKNL